MNQGQPQPPTFQSLVETLKPDTRRRLMRIFNKFGDVDQLAVNKIIEWSYERGKADAINGASEMIKKEQNRITSIFAGFPKFGR